MLIAKNVSKYFRNFIAVHNFSCDIPKATIVGLLGANGAGKTTVMRMLSGYYSPDQGSIYIAGYETTTHPYITRTLVGYLPENPALYPDLQVKDYLRYVAQLKQCEAIQNLDYILEITQLTTVQSNKICTLSRGYRQRVGLAQTLVGNPPILIMDEPTVGLDPCQIQEMRCLLKELVKTKTILISTHILSEVEQICDRVIILNHGEIQLTGIISDLIQQYIILTTTAPAEQLKILLSQIQDVVHIQLVENQTWRVQIQSPNDLRPVIGWMCHCKNWPILKLELQKTSLEQIYLQSTKNY